MKQICLYQCEICGTQYKSKMDAQTCEKTHKKPIDFEASRYVPYKNDESGYPVTITVKFKDDKFVMYKKIGLERK